MENRGNELENEMKEIKLDVEDQEKESTLETSSKSSQTSDSKKGRYVSAETEFDFLWRSALLRSLKRGAGSLGGPARFTFIGLCLMIGVYFGVFGMVTSLLAESEKEAPSYIPQHVNIVAMFKLALSFFTPIAVYMGVFHEQFMLVAYVVIGSLFYAPFVMILVHVGQRMIITEQEYRKYCTPGLTLLLTGLSIYFAQNTLVLSRPSSTTKEDTLQLFIVVAMQTTLVDAYVNRLPTLITF
ncbi:hypothetical protein NEDG_01626 [Nematocida displodere]|uniref:Uncharacterized protein n=1 Tax=Nematocida displodere TaxID=1805483 RepID=A0A177EGX0_9MICR|nr:hypothetical protein NEDG_01626 [Nematocida displodere]